MRVVEPVGHAEAVRGLFRAAAAERLGHAICLRGPRGVGKFAAAVWLAQGLLCAELARAVDDPAWSPCGVCPSCKKVASGGWRGNHPDLLVVDPGQEGWNEIPVQAVASRSGDGGTCIGDFLRLSSAEGRGRVVIVREAERLNLHAQNALLKTLEEPSDGTFLVLETSRPEALLETIASRVLGLGLGRLSPEETRRVLASVAQEDEVLRGFDLEALARIAEGSPGEARRLARTGGASTLALIGRWLSGGEALATASAVWEIEGVFEGSTPLAQDRARARQTLDLLREVLAEAHRRAVLGEPARGPLSEATAGLTGVGAAQLVSALDRVLSARADIDHNLDPGATLERALVAVESALGLGAAPSSAG
jgi:DNA polymerase-3 subunit delta'